MTPDNPRAMKKRKNLRPRQKRSWITQKEKAGRPEKAQGAEIVRRERKTVQQGAVEQDRFRRSGHAVP